MSEDFAAEFHGLPEYVITHIRTEKLKNGNTRIYHWEERNGVLVPAFMAFVASSDLVIMNDQVQDALTGYVQEGRSKH